MNEILADLRVLFLDIWYYISAPFKRMIYGYTERDLWCIGETMARKILPIIKEFRKRKLKGHPSEFKSIKEWIKAIDEMIYGLEYLLLEDNPIRFNLKNFNRAQKGRELLGKYFNRLWD